MSREKLAKNTTFFTLALAAQKILSFVYFIFIARGLGVTDIGRYSFALSFTTIFAMFLDFGTNQALIRESAKNKDNAEKYLASVLGLKALGAVVIYGAVVLAVNLMGYPEITKNLVYVSGLVMLLDSFSLSFYSVLRGFQNLKFESLGVVLNQFIVLIVGLVILWLNLGVVVLMSAYLVGSLFNFLFAFLSLRIKYNITPKFNWNLALIKQIIKWALPFAIAGFFIRLYSSSDMILLSKLADDRALGLYSVAYKIVFAFQFVAVAFSASIYPAFCHYFVKDKQELSRAFAKSMYYLMLLALPISIGVIAIADKVIGPVFGFEYEGATLTLQIMISALIFIFLGFPIGALLNASGRQTQNTIQLGLVSIFNIILNLIFIPLWQQNGSSLAALLSYILLFSMGIVVAGRIIDYDKKYLWLSFFKVALSCLLMAIVVIYLKDHLHFVLAALAGGAVYVASLLALKGFTKKDFMQMKVLILKK